MESYEELWRAMESYGELWRAMESYGDSSCSQLWRAVLLHGLQLLKQDKSSVEHISNNGFGDRNFRAVKM